LTASCGHENWITIEAHLFYGLQCAPHLGQPNRIGVGIKRKAFVARINDKAFVRLEIGAGNVKPAFQLRGGIAPDFNMELWMLSPDLQGGS